MSFLPEPVTPLFYLTGGILSTLLSGLAYRSYHRSKNRVIKHLSLSFAFLALHALSLSLPALIVPNNLPLIAEGFILGMVFLFLLLISAMRLQISMREGFLKIHAFVVYTVLVGIGATVVWLEISNFHLPIVGEWGTIFWSVDRLAAWLTGLTCLIYGLIWADFFQQIGRGISRGIDKFKMHILSLDGVMLGVSALLVFTSSNAVLTVDRKSTRLNSSHIQKSRMPSSA